jgi:hypothetical protein
MTLVGVSMSSSARSDVDNMLADLNAESFNPYANLMSFTFSLTFLSNTAALVVGFLAAGKLREHVFGAHSAGHPALLKSLQFCAGPCSANIVQTLVWITLLMQLALSYIFLLIWVLLFTVSGICGASKSAIDSATDLISQLNATKEDFGFDISQLNIDQYCKAGSTFASAGMYYFLGCVITVVSQAWMLSFLAKNKERISEERRRDSAGLQPLQARDIEVSDSM